MRERKSEKGLVKEIVSIVLICALVFCLCGCSGTKDSESGSTGADTRVLSASDVSMSYDKFNGCKAYDLCVDKDDTIVIDVETLNGELDVAILNDREEQIFSEIVRDNKNYSVIVGPGEYVVTLNGQDHSGQYSIDWGTRL